MKCIDTILNRLFYKILSKSFQYWCLSTCSPVPCFKYYPANSSNISCVWRSPWRILLYDICCSELPLMKGFRIIAMVIPHSPTTKSSSNINAAKIACSQKVTFPITAFDRNLISTPINVYHLSQYREENRKIQFNPFARHQVEKFPVQLTSKVKSTREGRL